MNLKTIKSSTFIKYIASYFVLLIIPVLIISIIIQTNIFNKYKAEIISNARTSQQNVSYNLKNGFIACSRIVDQLLIGNKLTSFSLENEPGKGIELVQTLKGYGFTNQFFDHIFVHFFDDMYIYSESSSYTKATVFDIFKPTNISSDELMNDLYSIEKPTLWKDITFMKNGTEKTYILYSFPLKYSSIPKGFVTFFIDSSKISNLLDNSTNSKTSLLVNLTGDILYDANINHDFYTDKIQGVINDTLKDITLGTESFKSDENYAVYSNILDSSGIVYFSIIETNAMFKDFIISQQKVYLGIFISLIIGSIIIGLLMKLTYSPIRKLKTLASSINHKKTFIETNEFELIKSTLNYFFERNNELESELQNNLPIKQYYLLSQLINGNITDKEKFLEDCRKYSIELNAKYHTVITIKSASALSNYMDVLSSISSTVMPISYSYVVEQLQSNVIILVSGSDKPPSTKNQSIEFHKDVIVALGSTKENIMELYKSYIESRSIINFPVDNSEQNIIVFSETSNALTYTLIAKCSRIAKNIKKALNNEDVSDSKSLIDELFNIVNSGNYPIDVLKKIFIEILVIFNIYFEKNKNKYEYVNIDFQIIYEIEDISQLKEVFSELLKELLAIIKKKLETKSPLLSVSNIKAMIEENYKDYAFSIQGISSSLGVSVSYLSQYYKDKTGSTIIDYITQLKMEESKKLLRTTDLSLKEIAEQVGYINISSFIRRFKQITGTTPGEYKKNNRCGEI